MHDIEQNSSQGNAAVKRTNVPRQTDRQAMPGAGAVPVTSETKDSRWPSMLFLLVGGAILLVLAVIFSGAVVSSYPSSQPKSQSGLRSTPTSSPANSSQSVFITIADGVAYTGADGTVYALRTGKGTLRWHSQIDGAVGDQPVVVDGVIYVTASTDTTATLYALRESDGSQLWHTTSNGPEISAPVVVNGVLYVGTQEDKVLALRANNGTLLWQYSDNTMGLLRPQLVDGVVYVTATDEQPGNVFALRASDGRLLWHYRAGDSVSGTTLIDGVAYITAQDGMLTALRASDGHQLWQHALGSGNQNSLWLPTHSLGGVLYLATTNMSTATSSASSPVFSARALVPGFLLGSYTQAVPAEPMLPRKEGVSALYAIRVSDGAMLWHFTMNNGKNGIVGWLSVEGGVVYADVMDVSTSEKSQAHIYALQSTTGSVLWHYDDTATTSAGALLTNGVIYVSAYSQSRNRVYALRVSDGSLLWQRDIDQTGYNAPVLNGTTVYVGTADGSVYALRTSDGVVEWHQGPVANR